MPNKSLKHQVGFPGLECCCSWNLSCTPNLKPWWLASNSCVLQSTHRSADNLQLTQLTETAAAHAAEQSSNTAQFSTAVHHESSSYQPYGSDQHLGPDISLLSSMLQRQWDHAKNAHLGNILIRPYSHKRVWWQCDQCPLGHPHAWEAEVRSRGRSCPFCASQRVCQHNSLATKHPDIAAEISPRNQGTAHDYTAGSEKNMFWRCKHGHEWTASILKRTIQKNGCPACFASRRASRPQQQHPFLADSHHAMMQYWDSEPNAKEGLDSSEIRCRSNKLCNWVCHCCPKGRPHRWRARPGTMYLGHGCPCCSGHKVCICNSLQSLCPEVAADWDYSRNTGTPDDYPAGSRSKVWWCTDKRGSFQAHIHDRTSDHRRRLGALEARQ